MPRLKAPQRREQLIGAATKVFAKWGYEAATTAAIAEAAGVTEPILYRHFENKQALFVAITREVSGQTLRSWRELVEGVADPAEQVRAIARAFPEHVRRLSCAYQVIHGALATSRDRRVQAVMREHYAQVGRFFAGVVVAGQDRGCFRADLDPQVPAWQLINIGIGYAMIALNLQPADPFDVEAAIEFILRGLAR